MAKQNLLSTVEDLVMEGAITTDYFKKFQELENSYYEECKKREELVDEAARDESLYEYLDYMRYCLRESLFPLNSHSLFFAFYCASSSLFVLFSEDEQRDILFHVLANYKNQFEPSLKNMGLEMLLSKNDTKRFERKKEIVESLELDKVLNSRWNKIKQRLLNAFPGLFALLNLAMPVTEELTALLNEVITTGSPLVIEPVLENRVLSDSFLNKSVEVPNDSFLEQSISGVMSASEVGESQADLEEQASAGEPPRPADLGEGTFPPPHETSSDEDPIPKNGRRTPEESFVVDEIIVETENKMDQNSQPNHCIDEDPQSASQEKNDVEEEDFLNKSISLTM